MTPDRQTATPDRQRILLTGASGYVGGRLLRVLVEQGHRVRCMARHPEHLRARGADTIVKGDVLDPASLDAALAGTDTAYYLVHSMGTTGSFEEQDRRGALNFGRAARASGVRRIIYLGGLADESRALSPHLRSRHETGAALRESGTQVIEFRASIVIGSGSLSFEMIRSLVEKLPVMTTPRWVSVEAQPIAIDDLLAYLARAVDLEVDGNPIYEIGGRDVISYMGLMREYGRQRGLRRLMIPVPVLTPRLSSLWLGLVTPLFARIGRKLIDSIQHPSVVRDVSARAVFAIEPRGVAEAMSDALSNEDRAYEETHWSDSVASAGRPHQWGGVQFGARLVDSRSCSVPVSATRAFVPIRRIGGEAGWYAANLLWRLRGWLDLLVGGVGLRRGRRNPDELRVGDVLDWWRVEQIEPDRLLRLRAEMKLPGRAWLEFEVKSTDKGSEIFQTAIFDPVGVAGRLYWYGIYPVHEIVFRGMLREIARRACEAVISDQ